MWSFQNLLCILCIALSCVTSAADGIHVSGYEGRDVKVSCPYDRGYESYEKYLCKNDCGDSDVLITTSQTKQSRYSIHDDKKTRVFTVTISDLLSLDAGKYWCGVTRTGADIYTEVKLEIRQDSCCNSVTRIQSHEEGSASISCPYESEYQNNLKYFCRGTQPSTCLQQAAITSDNKQNGRFRLHDDKVSRKFTVTISSLTQKDSGSYLCGVHRNTGLDVFSAAELEVKEWCCVKPSNMSGMVGRPVTLQCPYPPQHRDNRKFLCKGDHHNSCTDTVMSQSRFTLQEDVSSSSFWVTITELEAGDAGMYWCGSDSQWSVGNYTQIQLSVVSLQQSSTARTVGTNSSHVPEAALYPDVVFIAPAVVLTLVFALVIACKYKCYKVRAGGVVTNRNKPRVADAEEVMGAADVYANKDVIMHSKQRTSKQQKTYCHYDDAEGDQPDYENFTTTEEIYCNESYHKASNR